MSTHKFSPFTSRLQDQLESTSQYFEYGPKLKLIKSLEVIDQKSLLECLVHADSAIRMDALQVLIGDKKNLLQNTFSRPSSQTT